MKRLLAIEVTAIPTSERRIQQFAVLEHDLDGAGERLHRNFQRAGETGLIVNLHNTHLFLF